MASLSSATTSAVEPPQDYWASAALVYSSVAPATLVSRSWNLLRHYLKPSLLVMLVPAFLDAVNGMLMSLPSLLPSLTNDSGTILIGSLAAVGVGFLFSTVSFFLRLYCLSALSYLYYQGIRYGRYASLRECFDSVLASWFPLLGVFFVSGVTLSLMVVLNVALILLGVFVVSGLTAVFVGVFGTFSSAGMGAAAFGIALFLLLLLLCAVLGVIFWALFSAQMLVCFVPVVAVVNDKQSVTLGVMMRRYMSTFGLLFNNVRRMLLFGFLITLFVWVLSLAMSLPAQAWYFVEYLFRASQDPGAMKVPVHVLIAMNVYSVFVSSVLWPLMFAGVTLFWYDCRVRSEGFDIRIKLFQMSHRLKQRVLGS